MSLQYFRAICRVTCHSVATVLVAANLGAAQGSGVERLEPIAEVVAEGGEIRKLDITSDGGTLVTMSELMLHVWDVPSGELRYTRSVAYPENKLQDFDLDERTSVVAYVSAGEENEVTFFDLRSGRRVHPGGSGVGEPRSWVLPATWTPETVDLLDDQSGMVAAADAFGNISILDVASWMDVAFSTNNRLRTAYWLDRDSILWTGPAGVGILGVDGTQEFVPMPHQRAYPAEHDVLLQRSIEDGTVVRAYTGAVFSGFRGGRLPAVAEWFSDPALGVAGVVRLDEELASPRYLQGYSSGRLELREGGDILWAGDAMSQIEEVNGLDAIAFDATASGDVIAVARDVVVSIYSGVEVEATARD